MGKEPFNPKSVQIIEEVSEGIRHLSGELRILTNRIDQEIEKEEAAVLAEAKKDKKSILKAEIALKTEQKFF